MKNNHCKIARKIKLNINLKRTKAISKAFKRKGELDDSFIHKQVEHQMLMDECHQRNGGGWRWADPEYNPMFTSRNSHKKTNHK